MKQFLITYRVRPGLEEQRQQEIDAFIAALDADPGVRGRVTYRCMKGRETRDYYHLATAAGDDAVKALQSSDYFTRYTDQTERAAEGEVIVTPLELIAETTAAVPAGT